MEETTFTGHCHYNDYDCNGDEIGCGSCTDTFCETHKPTIVSEFHAEPICQNCDEYVPEAKDLAKWGTWNATAEFTRKLAVHFAANALEDGRDIYFYELDSRLSKVINEVKIDESWRIEGESWEDEWTRFMSMVGEEINQNMMLNYVWDILYDDDYTARSIHYDLLQRMEREE